MKDILKPAIALIIISSVAAGMLGYVNSITLKAIEAQILQAQADSMNQVLPNASSFGDTIAINEGIIDSITPALDQNGDTIGYAIAITTTGFGSGLQLMYGINSEDNSITGLSIISSENETPGLGANINNPEWTDQFIGKSGNISVTQDGGDIDAISSATITSRAVTDAATTALNFYEQNLKGGNN